MVEEFGGEGLVAEPELLNDDQVRKAVIKTVHNSNFNRDGGPGIPMFLYGTTKGDILDEHESVVVDLVCRRIKMLRDTPHSSLVNKSAIQLVNEGYVDIVKLFIKDEPHKNEKISSGRFRLIFSRSLIDEIVERVLYTELFDHFNERWVYLAPSQGIGFTDDMSQEFVARISAILSKLKELESNDISGWDFSVLYELLDALSDIYIKLLGAGEAVANIIKNEMFCVARKVMCASDGKLYICPLADGIMSSGCFKTGNGNSILRAFLATVVSLICGAEREQIFNKTMGDDCVEDRVGGERRISEYLKFGFRVTDTAVISESSSGFSFCSHWFDLDSGLSHLESWAKMVFKNVNSEFGLDRGGQVKFELNNHPRRREILDLLKNCGWARPIKLDELFRKVAPDAMINENETISLW